MTAIHNLLAQVDHAGINLTPGMAEGVARGNPRMIAYVANLVALRGKRPAIEPREDGGPLEPKKTYTINENQKETVVGKDGSTSTINDGKPATFTATQPGYVLPDYAKGDWRSYTKTDSSTPPATADHVMERLDGSQIGKQPNAPKPDPASAPAPEPSTFDKIATGISNGAKAVGNVAKAVGGAVVDGAVGFGKTVGTAATVAAQAGDLQAWKDGQPMWQAAGNSFLTGLTSMGANTNHFLGRFTDKGHDLKDHLDSFRAELDKRAPGDPNNEDHAWLKEQDKTLQQHLPEWYAVLRPLDGGPATADDRSMAAQRGYQSPENRALIRQYQQTHDPKVWDELERNITKSPEELAAEEMKQEVMNSEGGKKFDAIWGKGASENLVNTFHPVNLAMTAVPVGKGAAVAKAVINGAEQSAGKVIAGHMLGSVPASTVAGVVQQITSNPQASASDMIKGVATNVAANGITVGATGLVGKGINQIAGIRAKEALKLPFGSHDVDSAIKRLDEKGLLASDVQNHIDPNQVISLAERMRSGEFQNHLMDSPVIRQGSTQISGHHRTIAAEMAGYPLEVTALPPGTAQGQSWGCLPYHPGRRSE